MEGDSSNNILSAERPTSEVIEELQKQHEKKTSRIQELKRQIESAKIRLETKKSEVPEEKMEAFKTLSDKYNILREEHNSLLAREFGKSDK